MCRASGWNGRVQSVWSKGRVQSVWLEWQGAKHFWRNGRVQSILPEGPGGPDPVAGSRHRILSEDILHSRQVL